MGGEVVIISGPMLRATVLSIFLVSGAAAPVCEVVWMRWLDLALRELPRA
jgi:hypothetical protein